MISMNEKSYEGLSDLGILAHAANAIALHRRGIGTRNDCKLVISQLIRIFQSRLVGSGKVTMQYSQAARLAESIGEAIELEHAIPVGCVMNVLLHYAPDEPDLQRAAERIGQLITENSLLAYVTPKEHQRLAQLKFASAMPDGFDTYPWRDVWARYHQAEIVLEDSSDA